MNEKLIILVVLLVLPGIFYQNNAAVVKLTNAVCESHNKSWVSIDLCRLKVVQRNKVALNIFITLLHPANDISVKIQVVKKANGYKPWLINYTFDGCQFMRKVNHPLVGWAWKMIKDFSTINHTCPYSGVNSLKDFWIGPESFPHSIPTGDYGVLLTWIFDKKPQFLTNVYFSFTEDLL
ncbi:uncharacterized protein LOC115634799 [Scaptodrosophila lebanonensis]|uniref:Uncharacterized protein LOC115634799 n=1 Tax=Drosophila lebanonensis TaxID=7225 RepID=A0A6J2UMV6_DROLE|nr:uncharacterized protein LOC115634799 [Scaptodrosophila lebanonensis]